MGELIEVATLSDLPPSSCRRVDAAGRPVVLFNVNSPIYAIHGTCTHRGGPLGEGALTARWSPVPGTARGSTSRRAGCRSARPAERAGVQGRKANLIKVEVT
jgi:hypothetical protein